MDDTRYQEPAETEEDIRTLQRLIELGIALSSERDHNRLLELILLEAKRISNADGGTLYLVTDDNRTLSFAIMRNDTLDIALGGTTGEEIPFAPLALYNENGAPNYSNVATTVALTGKTVNIPNAYESESFDFSGPMRFDQDRDYQSTSFLTVPLLNHQETVIGVLQLINAWADDGTIIPFDLETQPIIEALSSLAAVALDNEMLLRTQRNLLDSFIKLIAGAIDEKSAYTGGHCRRVPALMEMLAKAACQSDAAPFRDFDLDEEGWHEIHLASWLHDCGKVTTPEYVIDKATKLETICNRIHEIRTRFEVLRRDAEIEYLKARLADEGKSDSLEAAFMVRCEQLEDDFAFIAACNVGGEFLDDEAVERISEIGEQSWTRYFDRYLGLSWEEAGRLEKDTNSAAPATERLLDDRPDHKTGDYDHGEIHNLSVSRGTLTEEERRKINDHIVVTIDMLNQLPFPRQLARVPEYAGGHHEKMDGTGYPRGLTRNEMSLPARMMAIADIFEALTAADRPYKKPKRLGECLKIMSSMRDDSHIDPALFNLFLTSGIWRDYAHIHMDPDQIDEVNILDYLNDGS